MRIPLSRNQTFFTFTKGICTMLWIIYAFGFPFSWISERIKVEKRGKRARLSQSSNAGQYEKNQELIHACLMKDLKLLWRWTNDARYFYMKFDGSEFCNYVTLKVQCCPYLRGSVRISFFVLHTINLYWTDKAYPYQALT